jgi:hypothetical protein
VARQGGSQRLDRERRSRNKRLASAERSLDRYLLQGLAREVVEAVVVVSSVGMIEGDASTITVRVLVPVLPQVSVAT